MHSKLPDTTGSRFSIPALFWTVRKGSYAGALLIHGKPTVVRLDGVRINIAGSVYLADHIADYVARIINVHTAEAG